ncbi:MAG: hypothetical protein GY786_10345 [Proteobacteria bacterium]|nr:hypothetical protein [Pseudomonadota bacterium]
METEKTSGDKQLTRTKSLLSVGERERPELLIRFISLFDKRLLTGIDQITEILSQNDFKVDHFEYKITVKNELRRPINPKVKNGPTEKVSIEEKININTKLKTIGQLNWRILKDTENVLAVQMTRSKGESLSLPLIYQNIFDQYKQILVTGLSNQVRLQLLAKPDLSFRRLPEIVTKNFTFREELRKRANRKKGMQSTARELLDLPGFPTGITKKINEIATGRGVSLSEVEAVNIILLSDLLGRYSASFITFQEDVLGKRGTVTSLARQFSDLMQDVNPKFLLRKIKDFFEPEDEIPHKDNSQIFSFVYSMLQKMDEKKIFVNEHPLHKSSLFGLIRSIFLASRSQKDPELWAKCLFFHDPEDQETDPAENTNVIKTLAEKTKELIITNFDTESKSLPEVYFVHNIQNYTFGRILKVSKKNLEPLELGIAKSVMIPTFGMKLPPKPKKTEEKKKIFTIYGVQHPNRELINPLHFLARCYGFLISQILLENSRKFLSPGVRNLTDRFGNNLFDIFYGKVVVDTGIPISRSQFAQWIIKRKLLSRIEEKGYISTNLDSNFDPLLTTKILMGSGDSILPLSYSQNEFDKEYIYQKKNFLQFFKKLERLNALPNDDNFSAVKIFTELTKKGKYHFLSSNFRNRSKKTFLYEELAEVVVNSCADIKQQIENESVSKKIILKIPHKFSQIIFIGQTFDVATGNQTIQVFLLPVPVKSSDKLEGLSRQFSTNFTLHLKQGKTPERKSLIQAVNILNEYKRISVEYFRLNAIFFIDRFIHQQLVVMLKDSVNTPSHIKHYFDDDEKLMVGTVKDINLSKIVIRDQGGSTLGKNEVTSISFGQFLQDISYFQNASKRLRLIKAKVVKTLGLLARFSNSLKAEDEWINYNTYSEKFKKIISLPITKIDAKQQKRLASLSKKYKKLVADAQIDGTISVLRQEWMRRNPNDEKGVFFFTPFVPNEVSKKDNLVLEIRAAQKLFKDLDEVKVIVFFPEASKKFQLRHTMEIGRFLKKHLTEVHTYIETSAISNETIEELAKVFNPANFFSLGKLEPKEFKLMDND